MPHRILAFLLVFVASDIAFAQGRRRQPPNPFATIVREHAKVRGFSGAVLVGRGDEVLYRGGVGMANPEWRGRNSSNTKFRIGSLTKAFTAAMILQLAAEGVLELDAPLTRYLPRYRGDTGDRVTIRHLLQHRSGIPSYTDAVDFRMRVRDRIEVSGFVEAHCSGDLEFEPGAQMRYSNSGYFLLGAVVEALTGKRYDVALEQRVLDPVGMRDTGHDNHRAWLPNRAVGHERVAGQLVTADFIDLSIPYAAGSLYSTVDDMWLWHRALRDDTVLGVASRKSMFTPDADGAGCGWFTRRVQVGGQDVLLQSHSGGIDGFTSRIVRLPEHESACVVVLSNVLDDGVGPLTRALVTQLVGAKPEPAQPRPEDAMWRRVFAGDLVGAQRLYDALGPRTADLTAAGQLFESAGRLAEAAAVYRFVLHMFPKSEAVRESLTRLSHPGTEGPQFVEQLQHLPGPIVWSEAVHPIDYDRDGRLDLIFANCNGWRRPGDMAAPSDRPLRPTLLRNARTEDGLAKFEDVTDAVLPGDFQVHSKNVAVCDVDGDGRDDLVFATAFGAQPRLLRFDPDAGRFVDETATRLPEMKLNSNGVSWGDLDDDGDLDLVFVDSGPNSDREPGGKARLLLNDGSGRFSDEPDRLGAVEKVGAQNAKLVDIDGDLDLDVVVDGKSRQTQLYLNDGAANFTLDTETIPAAAQGGQPYEIEWADLDGDGDLDAAHMSWGGGRMDRYLNVLLRNQRAETGALGFEVVEDGFVGRNREDENEFAFLDADDDGDLDLIVATLVSGPVEEKLYVNTGAFGPGFMRQRDRAFSHFTDGTLDLTIADFDGDGAYDIVTAQGESNSVESFRNRYYRNVGPKDTRPPVMRRARTRMTADGLVVRAFFDDAVVDDGGSGLTAEIVWSGNDEGFPMKHVGGGVFRCVIAADALPEGGGGACRVRVRDAVGNGSSSALGR